ncbi:MAG: type II toxin-antitoxin system HicA family toxin [Chloroflexota bacterium]
MSKLSPLKLHEVVRKLRQLGFDGPFSGGRHVRMVRTETGQIIPLPAHPGKDISVGLIRAIIREAGVTPEEWNRL